MEERVLKNHRFLYSVWRNRDDSLVILDGTAEECATAMGIKINSFYIFASRGGNGDWTITKQSIAQVEMESAEE